MALVLSAVEGVTLYVFTVPSIRTATLCTPSQLPSAGARVPTVAVATGFSPVAVKTMDVPSALQAGSLLRPACRRQGRAAGRGLRIYEWLFVS